MATPLSCIDVDSGAMRCKSLAQCVERAWRRAPELRTRAVLFDQAVEECCRSAALLECLANHCRKDPAAQCYVLCERQDLHSVEFGHLVRQLQLELDDAFRRIHIKYVLPPTATAETPPLIEILSGVQNLPFAPTIIAVAGITGLTKSPPGRHPPASVTSRAAEAPADAREPRPLLFDVSGIDSQHLALAAMLLLDAAAQAERWAGVPCSAVLWDAAASADLQVGLWGQAFDEVLTVGPDIEDPDEFLARDRIRCA